MDTSPEQLVREQSRAHICGRFGCSLRFVLPVQKRDETREVFATCLICGEKVWKKLPPEGYERFLKDFSGGKIK